MAQASKVTIRDVAEKAGVTHATVSRVIHGDSRISPTTTKRVRRMIKTLGYQPNLVARSLAMKETHVIAAIVPDPDPVIQALLRVIAHECRETGYALMLATTEYSMHEEDAYLSVVENWRVDGVLMYNVVPRTSLSREATVLLEGHMPCVFINRYLEQNTVDTVSIDNVAAVHSAVDHLVELGHTRIGTLRGSALAADTADRQKGFEAALKAHGLEYDSSITGDANYKAVEAIEEMKRILKTPNPPTAMFCANDLMAIGACRAIEANGLKVPDDISVIGFDDTETGLYHRPSITTLQPPLVTIGHEAVKLLIERMREPNDSHHQIVCEAKLIIRESTGPCPKADG